MEDDFYGIEMVVPSEFGGRKIGLKINDNPGLALTIPEIDTDDAYMRVRLTELPLPEGVHHFRFTNIGDDTGFVNFELFESATETPSFTHALDDYVLSGVNYVNAWKVEDGGHLALSGNRQLLYFGDDRFTDTTVSVDIEFSGDTATSTAGIVLRADNPAFTVHDSRESIQGYYIGLNNSKIFISRYNYNLSRYDLAADAISVPSGESNTLTAEIRHNTINVYLNGELMLTYTDAMGFTNGHVGLYTEGAMTLFRNLEIKD